MSRRPARHVLDYVLRTPWAIPEDTLRLMIAIASREQDVDLEALEAELGKPLENAHTVTVRDGVATIPVVGPMFRYADLFTAISGATSYDRLATDLGAALKDPVVQAILLMVDSPGGEVNGASDLQNLLYEARGQKPIVAHIGGYGTSAAYWIASAADRIVASDTALVGGLGVIATVTDQSGAQEDMFGNRIVTFVSSQTPDKTVDLSKKSDRARIQARINELADVFLGAVARNRDVDQAQVERDFGKGDVMIGAKAMAAGLVDEVATFEQTHRALARRAMGGASAVSRRAEVPSGVLAELPDRAVAVLVAAAERLGQPELVGEALHAGLLPQITRTMLGAGGASMPILILSQPADLPSASEAPAGADLPKEYHMPEKQPTGAAPSGAADELAVFKARLTEIRTLCEIAGVPEQTIPYAESDKTAAEISAELMRGVATRQGPSLVPKEPVPAVRVGADREAEEPFASIGEQCQMIRLKAQGHASSRAEKRLRFVNEQVRAATGLSEAVDSDGGFFLQPTLSSRMIEKVYNTGEILRRVTMTPIGPNSNSLAINGVDETSRADGSRFGGVRGYWGDEAESVNATKPKWHRLDLKLNKLFAAVYATEEEIEDVVALDARINRIVPQELSFKIEDAIVNGTGAGQPLGILNAGCLITVTKETNQLAATVVTENILKIYARAYGPSRSTGVWLYSQDIEPQLFGLSLAVGTGGVPVYMPPGGVSQAPYATLMGRPLIPVEYTAALGTVGDIVFAEFDHYEGIEKGGVNTQRSIHVQFLAGEEVFRFRMRVDGQPSWSSALTPKNAGSSLSPFVTLETRS
jgi:HK97 family phage major capsid protein